VARQAEAGLKIMINVGLTCWFKGHKQVEKVDTQKLAAV
jgi:hypothetical protein